MPEYCALISPINVFTRFKCLYTYSIEFTGIKVLVFDLYRCRRSGEIVETRWADFIEGSISLQVGSGQHNEIMVVKQQLFMELDRFFKMTKPNASYSLMQQTHSFA